MVRGDWRGELSLEDPIVPNRVPERSLSAENKYLHDRLTEKSPLNPKNMRFEPSIDSKGSR